MVQGQSIVPRLVLVMCVKYKIFPHACQICFNDSKTVKHYSGYSLKELLSTNREAVEENKIISTS